MKRLILSVAILAVAASCSTSEVTSIAPALQNEISFSTLNDRVVSKSANETNSMYAVLAYSSTSENAWYINDYTKALKDVDEAAADALNGTYYYPSADTYSLTFYAYAPYADEFADSSTAVDDTTTVGTATIAYTVPEDADEDFTIATPVTQVQGTTEAVSLAFSHMLSKVSVAITVDESLADGFYVTDVTTADISDGVSAVEETVTTDITAALTLLLDSNTADVTGDNTKTWTGTASLTNETDTDVVTYSANTTYNVLPQDLDSGCALSLENVAIVNQSTGYVAYSGALEAIDLSGLSALSALAQGMHYVFNINITSAATDEDGKTIFGSEITFVSTYASWDGVDGGNDTSNDVAITDSEEDLE